MGDNDAVQLASSSDSAYTAEMNRLYQTASLNATLSIDGTSEGHTSDSTADTNANPRPLVVGEVITYRMVIEIPEGTSLPDVQITDTLAPNIEFIAGSARISYSANNAMNVPAVSGILNELNPTTSLPVGLISFGFSGPRELLFDLGQVGNNDTDNTASAELLIIEFQAVVVNTSDNISGSTWSNAFEVDADNDGTDDEISNSIFSVIHEPVVTITKSIVGAADIINIDDTVTYDVTISVGGGGTQSTAYDLHLLDNLHADLQLDSVVIQTNPGYVSLTTDNSTYGPGGKVDILLNRLEPGDSVVIRIATTVWFMVSAGQTINNTANLTWTSLPGLKGTGNATPGNSGDTDGERNGNSTGENDYTATDNANFTIFSQNKFIDATDEPATSDTEDGSTGNERPAALGEKVTYRLVALLPESTSISFAIRDVLPTGVEFIPGSARVSYLASTLPSLNGDFAGIQNENNPTISFPASRINFDSGTRTLAFDFGSIINNDGDFNLEYLIIEFDTVVTDIGSNTTGTIRTNGFNQVIDEGFPTEVVTASNSVGIRIVEPDITLTKTFTPNAQIPGDNVSMTLVVDNLAANGATAAIFDLTLTDALDDWLNVTSVNVNFNTTASSFGSTFTNNSTLTPGFASGVSDTISIAISSLPIDGVATVTVSMQVDPSADPLLLPRMITNNASITGDSLASDITPDDEDRVFSANANDDLSILAYSTVTFNANGGMGSMPPQIHGLGLPTALTANTFIRAGYSFSGWNTAANGSGTAYADGATYDFSADVTLYAQWTIATTTLIVKSTPANDGWVLESAETSNVGGFIKDLTDSFVVGDDAADRQYRSFLHFDTSALPDNAVITSVVLRLREAGINGSDPFLSLGQLRIDMIKPAFGAPGVELSDFQAVSPRVNIGSITEISPSLFSSTLNNAARTYLNKTGTTQLRLYFSIDDNDNNISDFIRFYSGEAAPNNRPKLIITYTLP